MVANPRRHAYHPGNTQAVTRTVDMFHLLLNADLFTPEPLGLNHVLIAADRVAWIGPTAPDLDRSLGVHVVDLEGRRVIPGLIDCHAHVTGGGGETGYASRIPPLAVQRFTAAGITTVIGLLGTDDTVRTTGSLVAAVRGLLEEGISAWCHTGGYHLPPTTLTGSVRGDIVHIDRIIGVGETAISDHRSSQPTFDELVKVAADAHVAGLMTGKAGVVHLHLGQGARGLELVRRALDSTELPPRVFNPTHVNRRKALFEEAMVLARRGCSIDITAFPVGFDPDAWSAQQALCRYLDAGLPADRITVSSDGGGCLPRFDHQGELVSMDIGKPGALTTTLQALLEQGRPLQQVLPAFTSNVAGLLRLPRKGQLRPGSDADLVVLGADHSISDVMARGRWHVRAGEQIIRALLDGD